MSGRRSSADDLEPASPASAARTTDDLEMPAALRDALAREAVPFGDLDFEDVGPTEIVASDVTAADLDGYEPLGPGALVGRYRIERVLGRGGTGVVYEAVHEELGRRVALKCLFPHVAVQPIQVQRLFREAQIAARVEHPNVVTVLDGGRHGDTFYLAMERLEGRTLADWLTAERRTVAEIVALLAQVMDGVAAVHAVGVVHRDLKPENVFLCAPPDDPLHAGIPKVLDFGVSKLKEPGPNAGKLTAVGTVMGTPYYMAPEQVLDTSAVDQRADVYSLGVMLYEALAGQLPYPGNGMIEIFTQAQEGAAPPLRALRPAVPPGLAALVARAMSPEAGQRFASVAEMRAALAALALDDALDAGPDAMLGAPWGGDLADLAVEPTLALGAVRAGSAAPLAVEPTQALAEPAVGARPIAGPTPLTSPRLPPAARATGGAPVWVWLLVAAACGGLAAALGAVIFYYALA
ncbi:MAG: protein kinase [Sandaracinaceae bacterium]|nr:protein kinase [Sandaracinaceae bacterium]